MKAEAKTIPESDSVEDYILARWSFLFDRLETVAAHAKIGVAFTEAEEYFKKEVHPDFERMKKHFEILMNILLNSEMDMYPIPSHLRLSKSN